MLSRLFTIFLLVTTCAGAFIRLFPGANCPANGNYYQCNNTPANFCCYRRSPALKSAGIYGKPKTSQSAIYARVNNQNRCANQVQRYRGGNKNNVCIGSIEGQTFSLAGAAYFPAPKKRDLGMEEREEECEGSVQPDVAVLDGHMFELTGMVPAMATQLDEFLANGSSIAALPPALRKLGMPVAADQLNIAASPPDA